MYAIYGRDAGLGLESPICDVVQPATCHGCLPWFWAQAGSQLKLLDARGERLASDEHPKQINMTDHYITNSSIKSVINYPPYKSTSRGNSSGNKTAAAKESLVHRLLSSENQRATATIATTKPIVYNHRHPHYNHSLFDSV